MKDWPHIYQAFVISSPIILYLLYIWLKGVVKLSELLIGVLGTTALFTIYTAIIAGFWISVKILLDGGF